MSSSTTRAFFPLALLIGLQGIDVLLHIATDQIEPIRIAASAVVALAGLAAVFALRAPALFLVGSGLVYTAFNAMFLAENGLTNPETDSLRLPLFGFVILTVILLAWLGQRSSSD